VFRKNSHRAGLVAALIVPVVVAGLTVNAGAAGAASGRHRLPGTTPRWATAHQRSGSAPGSTAVNARIWLQYNNAGQALALARAVSDPRSASYRRFITAAQFNARFRPTDAQVASVTSWLASAGLKVASVPGSHRWVDFTGTVASVGSAFGTGYAMYRYRGHRYAAPSGDASVPASLAGTVLTVTGLDTMPHVVTPARSAPFPPEPGFRNATPCSTSYGEKVASDQPAFQGATLDYAVCGYKPPQLRSVYGQGALTGAGVTVAITDAYASPNIASDASTYAARNDPDHPYAPGQLTQWTADNFTRGQACGSNGWYGEETLDVEAVHAMAPGANIRYYGAASCLDDDLDAAIQQAMDDHVDVITNSWGEPELVVSPAAAHAESNMFQQAAATGISVLFSSGDSGDEAANLDGTKSADLPAASPWVTAVGGTSLGIAAGGSVALETGWGTARWSKSGSTWVETAPFLYGAGGGISNYFDFTQPDSPSDYQGADTSGVRRYLPDIGLDADPTTGMLVGETQRFGRNAKSDAYGEYRIGGTSLASPLFAGVVALAVQANGGLGLGLVNPAIYASQSNTSAIRDVTGVQQPAGNVRADFANGLDASAGILYSVRTFDQDSSLATEAGYDQVTGVGAPAAGFAAAIAAP
jgi:subtilase family serine protease